MKGYIHIFMAKLRPSKNKKITLCSAIAMTLLCLILGTVFLSNFLFWEKTVEKKDAIRISAVYESYYYKNLHRRASIFELYFKDAETLSIASVCVSDELFERLDNLPEGSRVDMLLHPNSDYVIEIKTEEKTIMDYEYATGRMHTESIGFLIFGLCVYAVSVYFIYQTIRLTRRRLKLNNSK